MPLKRPTHRPTPALPTNPQLHLLQQQRLPRQVTHLAAIDVVRLQKHRISGIVLDLDNTIVSEDDRYLSPGAEDWIRQAQSAGLRFCILSNGKRRRRVQLWAERLNVPAISPAHKPFPFAFYKALKIMRLPRAQVIVIGDSYHTDVLGAWLIGLPCIQVATLPHPARWWEKLLGQYVQVPYPEHLDLWNV